MAGVTPQQIGIPASGTTTVVTGDKRLTGNHTIVQWAHDVLVGLGLPTTPTNIAILVTWANVESGGYNPNASGGRNNPLNTTQPGFGGVGGGGQGNIMDYPTYNDGVSAIVTNLRNPRFGYPAILAGLRAQSPSQTFAAINASSFGTHISPNVSLTTAGIPGTAGPEGKASGATLTGIKLPNPLDILSPAYGLADIFGLKGIKNDFIYLGEVIGGFLLVVLGVVVVLVDTGALSKMPVPVPIPV